MGNFTNECGANNPLAQDVYFTQSLLDYLFYNGAVRACVGYTYLIGDAPGQRSLSRGSVAEHLGLIWAAGVLPTPRARTFPTTIRRFTFNYKEGDPVGCLPIHSFQFRALDRQESLQCIFQGSVVVHLQFNLHLDTLQFVPRCFSRLSENSP